MGNEEYMGTHPIFESDFDCLTDFGMTSELACTYAALILNDDDCEITGDKIATILKAAAVDVEPFWPSLFAGALKDVNVRELITSIASGAAAGGAAPAAADGEAAKVEEKKPESSSEE